MVSKRNLRSYSEVNVENKAKQLNKLCAATAAIFLPVLLFKETLQKKKFSSVMPSRCAGVLPLHIACEETRVRHQRNLSSYSEVNVENKAKQLNKRCAATAAIFLPCIAL